MGIDATPIVIVEPGTEIEHPVFKERLTVTDGNFVMLDGTMHLTQKTWDAMKAQVMFGPMNKKPACAPPFLI